MDNGDTADLVFLDFSSAFDSVNPRFSVHKLNAYGINDKVVNGIDSFPKERTFNVSINGSISPSKAAMSGVPQGPVLGPNLFLLYVRNRALSEERRNSQKIPLETPFDNQSNSDKSCEPLQCKSVKVSKC